jgi:general stress protein CsbA
LKTLFDAIIFFLAMGLFVIGIYESMTRGVSESYWIFMISLSLLFLYGYRKNMHQEKNKKSNSRKQPAIKGKKK